MLCSNLGNSRASMKREARVGLHDENEKDKSARATAMHRTVKLTQDQFLEHFKN